MNAPLIMTIDTALKKEGFFKTHVDSNCLENAFYFCSCCVNNRLRTRLGNLGSVPNAGRSLCTTEGRWHPPFFFCESPEIVGNEYVQISLGSPLLVNRFVLFSICF